MAQATQLLLQPSPSPFLQFPLSHHGTESPLLNESLSTSLAYSKKYCIRVYARALFQLNGPTMASSHTGLSHLGLDSSLPGMPCFRWHLYGAFPSLIGPGWGRWERFLNPEMLQLFRQATGGLDLCLVSQAVWLYASLTLLSGVSIRAQGVWLAWVLSPMIPCIYQTGNLCKTFRSSGGKRSGALGPRKHVSTY